MAIIESGDYPSIRAAIDLELDTNSLPDAKIALDIFSGAADQDVLERDPDAESRTGEDANRVTRAAIFFCAARLVPVVMRTVSLSATTRDLSYTRKMSEIDARVNELKGQAVAEIDEVLDPDNDTASMPRMFTYASGDRGR